MHNPCPGAFRMVYVFWTLSITLLFVSISHADADVAGGAAMSHDGENRNPDEHRQAVEYISEDLTPALGMRTFLNYVEVINEINPDHARQWLEKIGVKPEGVSSVVDLAINRGRNNAPSTETDPSDNCDRKAVATMTLDELLDVMEEKHAREQRGEQARYEAMIVSLDYEDLLQIEHWIDANLKDSTSVKSIDLRKAAKSGHISREKIEALVCSDPPQTGRDVNRLQMEDEHGEQTIWIVKKQR